MVSRKLIAFTKVWTDWPAAINYETLSPLNKGKFQTQKFKFIPLNIFQALIHVADLSPKVKAMAKKESAFQSCPHQICIHIQGLAFLLWLFHTPPTPQKGMPTTDQLTTNSAVDSLDTITTLMYNHLYHFLVWTHPWGTGEICCSGPRQLQLS